MPACNCSLSCAGSEERDGLVHGDDAANLVIIFGDGGKLVVDHDGNTITVEGDVRLERRGHVRFGGGLDLDLTSGVTDLNGKLTIALSQSTSFQVTGQVDPHSGAVSANAMLTLTF